MSTNIDTILSEQTSQLDKERLRLAEDLESMHLNNNCSGGGDNGGSLNGMDNNNYPGEESSRSSTARSTASQLNAEKRQKEEMNQAISDHHVSEAQYGMTPEHSRTGRRLVRPQVIGLK